MSVTQHVYTATLQVGVGHPLKIVGGSVTMDEGRAPHVQASLTIATPTEAVTELLDPRKNVRVKVTATSTGGTARTFDLVLRARVLDHNTAETSLKLASDEALLLDDALAATTPNVSALAYQASLRAIINQVVLSRIGATLQPGTTDAPYRVLTDAANMFENASVEGDVSGGEQVWAGQNIYSIRDTSWASVGAASIRLYSPLAADSSVTLGGDGGSGMRNGMRAGTTYTASADFRLAAALGGTEAIDGRARTITAFYADSTGYHVIKSNQAPNAPGVTRLSVTFTIPADATEAFVRFYHGHSAGESWWDALRLSENTGAIGADLTTYFDGNTPDTEEYSYQWDGVDLYSTSRRIALVNRAPEALVWEPGVSAWDFVQPLFQASGFRLFCDESRKWYLVDTSYLPAGYTQIAAGRNVTQADDEISRDSDEWYDAVLVKYTWRDSVTAEEKTAYDVAAPAGYTKLRTMQIPRPFPGPGLASYALKRAGGKGRVLSLSAISEYSVTPTQPVAATLPGTPIQTGVVASVEWNFDIDEMTIATRGLTDTPPTAWVFLPTGESWTASPTGASWLAETIGA